MKPIRRVLFLVLVAGCGHTIMRGTVVMKINETDAHVCLGRGEVARNDLVTLYKNECGPMDRMVAVAGSGTSSERTGSRYVPCVKRRIGGGRVVDVLNDHYSVVRFGEKLPFKEGDTVEKP